MNAFAYVAGLTVFGYNQLELYETYILFPNTMHPLITGEQTKKMFR